MRRIFLQLGALLLPALAVAQTGVSAPPQQIEGSFELVRAQPRCVRAPCPPHWRLTQGGQRHVVRAIAFDPATSEATREAITRVPEFTALRIEGRARIENGEALILAHRYQLAGRR